MLVWLHVVALCTLAIALVVVCGAPRDVRVTPVSGARIAMSARLTWIAVPLVVVCTIVVWSGLGLFAAESGNDASPRAVLVRALQSWPTN